MIRSNTLFLSIGLSACLLLSAAILGYAWVGYAIGGFVQPELQEKAVQLPLAAIKAKDSEGKEVTFEDFLGQDGSVVCFAFLYPDCPLSQRYGPVLHDIQQAYQNRGVRIVGIICELKSQDELRLYKEEYGIDFPIYTDEGFHLVTQMGVTVTPEVVVVNAQGGVLYQGRVDDRYRERGVKTPGEPEPELINALEDVLANRPVRTPKTEPAGCPIDRPEPVAPSPDATHEFTFYNDIRPFLRANCQVCHSPNNTAPFSLLTYSDVVDWIELGIDEIEARRMPPAQIETETTLLGPQKPTDAQIKMLKDWISAGKPEGDPASGPTLEPIPDYSKFDSNLGPPDLILEQDGETTLGATGIDLYANLVYKLNNPKDLRVRAVQFLPRNRKIVHHTLIGHVPHEIAVEAITTASPLVSDSKDDKVNGFWDPHKMGFRNPVPRPDGYPRMAFLCGYIPGTRAIKSPEDAVILIPSGSDLIVNMHYSRSGKIETDTSRLGIWFEKSNDEGQAEHKRNMQLIYMSGDFVVIPPGVKDFRVKAEYTLPHDSDLVLCIPHAHQLARWIEINLYEPNQPQPKLLVRIPRWDFNWQSAYYAGPPSPLLAGTRIEAIASYDNTNDNPFNSFNPPHPAWHAENTVDEMLLPMLGLSSSHVLDPTQQGFADFVSKVGMSRFVRRLVEHRYKYLANPDGSLRRSPDFNSRTDE